MTTQINPYGINNGAVNALHLLGQRVNNSGLDQNLLELLYFRVSQINQCGFCLDMHSKKLRANGETEQRLYLLSAWRETPFYSEKERAALAYAEAFTQLPASETAQQAFEEARAYFSDEELVNLTMAIIAINGYNRVNIAFSAEAGVYQATN